MARSRADTPERLDMPKHKTEAIEPIDDFAMSIFGTMGYDTAKLPDALVKSYTTLKRRKDVLHPGRLTPEGFAMVTMLADMAPAKRASRPCPAPDTPSEDVITEDGDPTEE